MGSVMGIQVSIEHHPENEPAPFVVRLRDYDRDANIWFACRSRSEAEDKQCDIVASWPLARKRSDG